MSAFSETRGTRRACLTLRLGFAMGSQFRTLFDCRQRLECHIRILKDEVLVSEEGQQAQVSCLNHLDITQVPEGEHRVLVIARERDGSGILPAGGEILEALNA